MRKHALIHRDENAVSGWLLLCLLMVALMVAVGGYTRLSGSGLSITEWKPVHGVIPPYNETLWREEFDAYRATPQYAKINKGMTLDEFKVIYWPEYLHRLLGRLVGFIVLIPFVIFTLRKSFTRPMQFRMLGIFALGGLQGLIGWYMVQSGLINDPFVSPVRLALHLSVAFAIFALLLWTWLDIKGKKVSHPTNKIRYYKLWLIVLCIQIIYGAFVAGLHAGLIYNTFPTMNGEWIPGGMFNLSPWYINIFENITFVQFVHRWLAVAVVFGYLLWWYLSRAYVKDNRLGGACLAIALVLLVQFTLGIKTLLFSVPLPLALSHQMVALLLFAAAVNVLHKLTNAHET